ncbi:E3 ubiquitin-protein ligase TRIM17-like [Pelodiscus sinensis]|uniref:E3 ubiquitin-protein ligase TRIM17-like n=1 Tax=Pelodiscus sinensis TaxID=13735 RepID=UPI003F6CB2F4
MGSDLNGRRRTFPQGNLRPNRQLRSIVDAARALRLLAGREPAPERLCEKHQEPLKLFCREDEIPICVVCDRSKGHRAHTGIPAEEAAEEFQERLQAHLKTLRIKRQKLLGLKVNREKTSQKYLPNARPRQSSCAGSIEPGRSAGHLKTWSSSWVHWRAQGSANSSGRSPKWTVTQRQGLSSSARVQGSSDITADKPRFLMSDGAVGPAAAEGPD